MKPRRPANVARIQILPEELMGNLLAFLQAKFYQGHGDSFAKDRKRLLQWVVLWPAKWLDDRGVSLPPERYRELFMKVMLDCVRFGQVDNVTYLPAYLAKCIQSHFQHHGDEIYAEAKSMRNLTDHAALALGRLERRAPDPVRELAAAARLLKSKKKVSKSAANDQLTLL